MSWESEKERVFEMLDGVIAVLAVELGHEPTGPEIMARLASMAGCYIGASAEGHADPDAFIEKAAKPISHTARAVHQELTQQRH